MQRAGGSRWRALAALAAGAAALAPVPQAPAQDSGTDGARVIVVARERVLHETEAGAALREAESRLTAEFQTRVDAVKRQLEAEEAELARLRGTIPRSEFQDRTEAFDRKVRAARRESQRQAAALQQAFREARDGLVRHLAPILIDVLRAEGADIILDAGDVLVASPTVDMTDEVISLFDERVDAPEIDVAPGEPLLPEDGAEAPE